MTPLSEMGKKSRHRSRRYKHGSSKASDYGESEEVSYFFREYKFEKNSFRLEWGLLTLDNIRELDLSGEEFAAMLLSQLDLRDTCIDALGNMVLELLEKGCCIEKNLNYLSQQIWDHEQEYSRRKSKKDDNRRNQGEDEPSYGNAKEFHSEDSQSPPPVVSQKNTYKTLHSPESPVHGRKKKEVSENSDEIFERDKIKAMVAKVLQAEDREESKHNVKRNELVYDSTERDKIRAMVAMVLGSDGKKSEKDSKNKREEDDELSERDNIKAMVAKVLQNEDKKTENVSKNIREEDIDRTEKLEEGEWEDDLDDSSERDKIKAMVAKALKARGEETEDVSEESSDLPQSEQTDEISGKSTSENSENDKIKAMVAMAFKKQGFGLFDGAEEKDSTNKNDAIIAKGIQSEEQGESAHGWDTQTDMSIAEQVQAVASEAVVQSGYAYLEELGLYYDYTSGYYYNAENGLYYDPKTGTYFYYDHTTQSYQFHSQVPVNEDSESADNTTATENTKLKNSDKEDAEDTSTNAVKADAVIEDTYSNYGSQAQIPPSLRLMVTASGSANVKIGTLHLVTMDGGRVGRAPENLVQLEDITVSKVHAELLYRSSGADDHHYYIKDLGSTLGTYINDTCICIPGEPSDEIEIGHGWELKFGTVKLKCHIHPGYLSCNECEPGIVMANLPSQSNSSGEHNVSVGLDPQKVRIKNVKAMKKKYALEYTNDVPSLPAEYEDRAQKRRKEKGSDNPYEKTEAASTTMEIKSSNKGFALMKKMGWNKGEALGKSQPGITEPIETTSKVGREGLGYGMGLPAPSKNDIKKRKILDVTRNRFNKI